jgi:integral membrane protein
MNLLKFLRIVAIIEGCTYLAFAVTVPMKRAYGMAEPNYYNGMAHGVLFILYVVLCFMVARDKKWNLKTLFWAQVASLLPFGTFVADAKIFKKEL